MPKKHPNGIDGSSQRVVNVGTPTAASDAATKAYVDAAAAGGGSVGGLTAAQARTIARRAAIRYTVR